MLQQRCPDWQWNGECHIAIMGKGERERGNKRGREEIYTALQQGSKIPQSVLAEQIETITVRGIFSFGIFSPPLHLICHEEHECSDQRERVSAKSCPDVCSILDLSWFYEWHVWGRQRLMIRLAVWEKIFSKHLQTENSWYLCNGLRFSNVIGKLI